MTYDGRVVAKAWDNIPPTVTNFMVALAIWNPLVTEGICRIQRIRQRAGATANHIVTT